MIETLRCQSCGAPILAEKLTGSQTFFICNYCGSSMKLSSERADEKSVSCGESTVADHFSLKELNAPAGKPPFTKIRLINEPGVRFYALLKGRSNFLSMAMSFIISLFLLGLPLYFEIGWIREGHLFAAALLMWGLSFIFLALIVFNARRAGLRGWPVSRIARTLIHAAVPNAAIYFLRLGFGRFFERDELIAENGKITLKGGHLIFGWRISRDAAEVTGVEFLKEGSVPLFSVMFKDASWTLGLEMSLDERRWVRTELARFLRIISC